VVLYLKDGHVRAADVVGNPRMFATVKRVVSVRPAALDESQRAEQDHLEAAAHPPKVTRSVSRSRCGSRRKVALHFNCAKR